MRRSVPILRTLTIFIVSILIILALAAFRGYQQNLWVPSAHGDTSLPHASFLAYFVEALKSPVQLFSSGRFDLLDIQRHMPLSFIYIILSFVLAYAVGITKGIADVFWKDKKIYRIFQRLTWVVDALPMFGVLTLTELGSVFAYTSLGARDPIHFLPGNNFWDSDFMLSCMLMFPPMMYISRLIRITILQEMGEQYVLTARSKGLHSQAIFFRHIYRNCLTKLLSEATTVFTMILSSLLMVEYLGWRWGGALDLFVSMGHNQIGDSGSLLQDPGPFRLSLVVDYLIIFALITILFQIISFLLKKRWQVSQNA